MFRKGFVFVIGLWLIAYGIGIHPVEARKKRAPKKKVMKELVWPLPPAKPRLKWITQYQTVEDFTGESGLRRALRKLTGEKKKRLFVYPTAVVTDPQGRIYVSDTGGKRVVVLDPTKKKVRIWYGDPVGFTGPTGLAYARQRHFLYVADSPARAVYGVDMKGKIQLQIKEKLKRPAGLAIDEQRHRLYVVDVRGHNIKVFDLDGKLLKVIGKRGNQPGEFNFPNFITVDSKGYLYVSDMGNFRVQILDPDGVVINTFGQPGKSPGDFMRPKGIAVDSENHIYVLDAFFHNLQIFDIFGRIYLAVGSPGREPGQFLLPIGVHIDEHNRVYILDQLNRRLQILEYLPSGEKAPGPEG